MIEPLDKKTDSTPKPIRQVVHNRLLTPYALSRPAPIFATSKIA